MLKVKGKPSGGSFGRYPMTRKEVEEKYLVLTSPILGKEQARELALQIWNLEKIADMRELRPLLSTSSIRG